jgi:hypothetical protein
MKFKSFSYLLTPINTKTMVGADFRELFQNYDKVSQMLVKLKANLYEIKTLSADEMVTGLLVIHTNAVKDTFIQKATENLSILTTKCVELVK